MKRLPLFTAFFAVLFLLSMHRALALYEFCPTGFQLAPIGVDVAPASLFGIQLSAEGPRSVTAAIAFDTTAGWFLASFPSTTLQEKDRHYDSPGASFVKRTW